MRQLTFAILLLACISSVCAMRKQSTAVKGRLHCGGVPAANVKVKLVDKDTGLDPDDEMSAGYTDSDGRFHLQGDETELTTIDPQLKIYHKCNHAPKPCDRKWVINIPDLYVSDVLSEGQNPKKVFDLGDVNLEVELEGETTDCIH
ncbi:hypothetical protein M3Y97_00559700 [Aphelenchoides bicaudatus]|nr:hypothetical protein M3Y97_00559700 [Aphelenchoides bicaudatus]